MGVVLQFIHRWFAFTVALSMAALFYFAQPYRELHIQTKWLLAIVILQIALGITTFDDAGTHCTRCCSSIRSDNNFY
jgi:heme A synthase